MMNCVFTNLFYLLLLNTFAVLTLGSLEGESVGNNTGCFKAVAAFSC